MIVQTCVNDISMSVEFLDEISLTTFDAALLKKGLSGRYVMKLLRTLVFYPTFSNSMQIEVFRRVN